MTTLTKNRYHQLKPTSLQPNGVSVSTPIYIGLTTEQNKMLLNGFRRALQARGKDVEEELGMNEENLRHALFGRNGVPERLVLKLQRLTGIELITKKQINEAFQAWSDYIFDPLNGDKTKGDENTQVNKSKRE